jgi:GGDEF domain-containing protein
MHASRPGCGFWILERSLKKANEEIKRLSVTDPLTGCYNRGYLNDRLSKDYHIFTQIQTSAFYDLM